MDEFLIVQNRSASPWNRDGILFGKKIILFRTYESHASYVSRHVDTNGILNALVTEFSECNIVILARYSQQIKEIQRTHNNVIVLEDVIDSGSILPLCDLFVGSGGTMTTEAVLRGVPTISYDAVPNYDEKHLVQKGMLIREKRPIHLAATARGILDLDRGIFSDRAQRLLSDMKDPYDTLVDQLNEITSSH